MPKKNPNNPAYGADRANRIAQGHANVPPPSSADLYVTASRKLGHPDAPSPAPAREPKK